MIDKIVKRNGSTVDFDSEKIKIAIEKAMKEVGEIDTDVSNKATKKVINYIKRDDKDILTVDDVHILVENSLMDMKLHDIAREYIQYRESHKPDIFKLREKILPYEYPEVMTLVDALHDSPWNHRHFNYEADVAYYRNPNTPQLHKTVYARGQLAISQIEVSVKSYWKKVDSLFPKHEFSMLAACFDNSEAIHFNTYKEGLERINLVDMFNNLNQYPVLKKRSDSLKQAVNVSSNSRKDILLKNIMFSSFIENVSLMSQFVAISSFDKYLKQYSGMSNGIKATAIEETSHFLAGVFITNVIKRENPELWTDDLVEEIIARSKKSLYTEYELIDWIFDNQDLEFLTRDDLKDYITKRMQDSLSIIGIETNMLTSERYEEISKLFEWFDLRIKAKVSTDFFANKDTSYAKGRAFTVQDAFNDKFYEELGELGIHV